MLRVSACPGQAMRLEQVQRQLALYQDSRKAASDEIARLTGSNISLSTELEITKLQYADVSTKISALKVALRGTSKRHSWGFVECGCVRRVRAIGPCATM